MFIVFYRNDSEFFTLIFYRLKKTFLPQSEVLDEHRIALAIDQILPRKFRLILLFQTSLRLKMVKSQLFFASILKLIIKLVS